MLEDFCCINFGGFSRGFSWRIFLGTFSHKNEEKNPARKSAKKSGGSKRKIREKSVLPKAGPNRSLATFHRTLKSQCIIAVSCLGNRAISGVRDGHRNRKSQKNRSDFGALRERVFQGHTKEQFSERLLELEGRISAHVLGVFIVTGVVPEPQREGSRSIRSAKLRTQSALEGVLNFERGAFVEVSKDKFAFF